MRLALGALLLIIGLGPEGMMNRFVGPLNERLSQKLWTAPAPMDCALVAAAFGHWRDTRVLLQIRCTGIAITLIAKRDHQPWCQRGSSTRKRIEQFKVRVLLGAACDLRVELCDVFLRLVGFVVTGFLQ